MTYDGERRLAHWQSSPSNPTSSADDLYDGSGNRVEQVQTVGSTTTKGYYLLGGVEEVATTGSSSTLTKYYSAAGLLIGESVGGTISYLASDGLGSVSEALDGAGNVTAAQLYGPYGGVRYSSGVMPTSKGFTGQRSDAATSGLDYYNARYYDPVIGQFASADTKEGPNRYAYVADDPETLTDPSGHRRTCSTGDCGGGGGGGSGGGDGGSGGGGGSSGCNIACWVHHHHGGGSGSYWDRYHYGSRCGVCAEAYAIDGRGNDCQLTDQACNAAENAKLDASEEANGLLTKFGAIVGIDFLGLFAGRLSVQAVLNLLASPIAKVLAGAIAVAALFMLILGAGLLLESQESVGWFENSDNVGHWFAFMFAVITVVALAVDIAAGASLMDGNLFAIGVLAGMPAAGSLIYTAWHDDAVEQFAEYGKSF